jgi:hypothetical protein
MKSLLVLSAALIVTLPSFAQRIPGSVPVGIGGYGNVLHPGTGGVSAGYAYRGPVKRSTGLGAAYYGGYPLYVGGAYVPSYTPDYSSQSQLYSPQQYSAPPVVINQYFAPPMPLEPITTFYQPASERAQTAEEDAPAPNKYYLLAFKDHSIYSALAYWVEDKTLHYVTTLNTHNQASLDLVDVELTKQLNRDREVPFSINQPSGSTQPTGSQLAK